MDKTVILVHGGAGSWDLTSARLVTAMAACREAALAGQQVLLAGGSALDAVETAVRVLEDCPVLDSGRGSYPNRNGEIEVDALIMDGRTLNLGAVAAVQGVRYPTSLARRVMSDTPHHFLVGAGAEAFADSIGFPRCELADLWVEEMAAQSQPAPTSDTVGAVALDADGNLAAATSTGGTRYKMPGRVGDSPLVGAGGYADNRTAAVSATGHGESLMKVLTSKQVCDLVAMGFSAQLAGETAVRLLTERTGGEGGLIAIDHLGQVGIAFNTTAMPYAQAIGEGEVVVGK
ncbi:MAG TPA: isoaspartyl peptidase/L-asparaginase [Chloroflexota bacterium]|nr:isoaspartyl peptidase/L-asparaginase [Chloroflexota bacterium]